MGWIAVGIAWLLGLRWEQRGDALHVRFPRWMSQERAVRIVERMR